MNIETKMLIAFAFLFLAIISLILSVKIRQLRNQHLDAPEKDYSKKLRIYNVFAGLIFMAMLVLSASILMKYFM